MSPLRGKRQMTHGLAGSRLLVEASRLAAHVKGKVWGSIGAVLATALPAPRLQQAQRGTKEAGTLPPAGPSLTAPAARRSVRQPCARTHTGTAAAAQTGSRCRSCGAEGEGKEWVRCHKRDSRKLTASQDAAGGQASAGRTSAPSKHAALQASTAAARLIDRADRQHSQDAAVAALAGLRRRRRRLRLAALLLLLAAGRRHQRHQGAAVDKRRLVLVLLSEGGGLLRTEGWARRVSGVSSTHWSQGAWSSGSRDCSPAGRRRASHRTCCTLATEVAKLAWTFQARSTALAFRLAACSGMSASPRGSSHPAPRHRRCSQPRCWSPGPWPGGEQQMGAEYQNQAGVQRCRQSRATRWTLCRRPCF